MPYSVLEAMAFDPPFALLLAPLRSVLPLSFQSFFLLAYVCPQCFLRRQIVDFTFSVPTLQEKHLGLSRAKDDRIKLYYDHL